MVTLFHCQDARSFRALWALEELGVPYDLKLLPFPPRVLAPDYLAINPLGTIPFFVDGETKMTESSAILQFLAVRHGGPLNVPVADSAYGSWLNWLYLGEATLTFPQTLVLRYTRLEPKERRNPQVAEDYARWFMARLRAVDMALETQDYLCAGRFTAADISVGYALLLASTIGLSERFSPAVSAYWARLQERPAFQRAKAAQAADSPPAWQV